VPIRKIHNKQLSISVSDSGAELRSLFSVLGGREWMWQGNPEFWPRTSPVLFPVVGKLRDNELRHLGKSYPLSQHGFARDRVFELLEQGDDFLRFGLSDDEQSYRQFPFPFRLEIAYLLEENCLQVSYRVENTGETEMPFSIGAHPGFSLPGWPRKKYYLELENAVQPESVPLESGLLDFSKRHPIQLNDGLLEISPELFLQDALVLERREISAITIFSSADGPRLKLRLRGFPWLGIWSKPGADFVCIEPWFGHADPVDFTGDFSTKPGIQKLMPAEVFECSFFIEVSE